LYPPALHAMMASDIHHRTEDFRNVYKSALADLKEVYGTQNDVLCFAASGTGAMDASVSNLFSRGDKVIAFKKRRRKNSRRKRGYRHEFSVVRITEILTGGAKPSKTAAPRPKREPKPKAEAETAPAAEAKSAKTRAKKPAKAAAKKPAKAATKRKKK